MRGKGGEDIHRLRVIVEGLDVAEVLDALEWDVRHSELFTLIDVRRSPLQVKHRGERCRGLAPRKAIVTEAAHDPRLIVVVPVEAVPPGCGETALPFAERLLEVEHSG